MIKKSYADLPYGQTHYRTAGQGEPVVLLHASPMSSAIMAPLINTLAEHSLVISPDTPGYGNSDPLSVDVLNAQDDLTPYAEWLKDFLDTLGFDKVSLYGSATGAQIGVEFARAYPQRLSQLVLDNAADFSQQECDDALEHYFPSIAPKPDGSHLMDVWNIAQSLTKWFPWYAQDDEHKVSDVDLPADIIHTTAMSYLTAGDDYAQAYRRAFVNEKAEYILKVTVPTTIIRAESSIVKKYVDRFDNYQWPDHIKMRYCGDVSDRYQAISDTVAMSANNANSN